MGLGLGLGLWIPTPAIQAHLALLGRKLRILVLYDGVALGVDFGLQHVALRR